MKKYIIFLICVFNLQISAQDDLDFYEVRVKYGASLYGFSSILLVREGLIYSTYFDHKNSVTRSEVKFIPYYLLDLNIAYETQNYASDLIRDSLWNVTIPSNIILGPNSIRVDILEVGKREYTSFLYRYCNHPIDKLIILMNSLIPVRDREAYGIPLKCK